MSNRRLVVAVGSVVCICFAAVGVAVLRANGGPERRQVISSVPSPRVEVARSGHRIPDPFVAIALRDITTAIGNQPIRVYLVRGTAPVTREMLDAVATRTSLRTWPEMNPVAYSVNMQLAEEKVNSGMAYIELTPQSAPGERWHALAVEKLPSPFTWAQVNEDLVLPSGTHVSRFKTGSAPVVRGARLVEKADGAQVRIEFSEPVNTAAAARAVSLGPTMAGCRLSGSKGNGEDKELRISCSGALRGASLQVQIDRGLRTAAGAELESGSALSYQIEASEWTARPDGTEWAKRKL